MSAADYSLPAGERIKRRKTADWLFAGGRSHSIVVFPVRLVYGETDAGTAGVEMLVSVSKRHFKRAVKRNRVKRQLREAYRTHKHLLTDHIGDRHYAIALIWLADEPFDSADVTRSVSKLLIRMAEKIRRHGGKGDSANV